MLHSWACKSLFCSTRCEPMATPTGDCVRGRELSSRQRGQLNFKVDLAYRPSLCLQNLTRLPSVRTTSVLSGPPLHVEVQPHYCLQKLTRPRALASRRVSIPLFSALPGPLDASVNLLWKPHTLASISNLTLEHNRICS